MSEAYNNIRTLLFSAYFSQVCMESILLKKTRTETNYFTDRFRHVGSGFFSLIVQVIISLFEMSCTCIHAATLTCC